MIAFLKGELKNKTATYLVILANGVGWKVNSAKFFEKNTGDILEIFIHTSVSENDISLWGFETMEELAMFELLLGVSGVGNKTAQLLVEKRGVQSIVRAIQTGDLDQLKVPGVGTKTVQKIQIDLISKIAKLEFNQPFTDGQIFKKEEHEELKQVLERLGYSQKEIIDAIRKFKQSNKEELSLEQKVKEILKLI